jgi:hypothetical protein
LLNAAGERNLTKRALRGSQASVIGCFIHLELSMKAIFAACVAAGILWAIDIEFNDSRYTEVAKRAVKSVLSR